VLEVGGVTAGGAVGLRVLVGAGVACEPAASDPECDPEPLQPTALTATKTTDEAHASASQSFLCTGTSSLSAIS